MPKQQRIQLQDDDGSEVVVYLVARTPLDGHGGRLRQVFTVLNRHYEEIGGITRYRNDYGTVTHWSATGRDLRQAIVHSRAEALHHLTHQP